MTAPFTSFAQNGEDVVIWRALGHIEAGFYVDVGANDPTESSVTRALYDRGWSGLTVEPVTAYAAAHRAERSRDLLVEAVAAERSGGSRMLHEIAGTGLSTLRGDIAERHADQGWDSVPVAVPALTLDDMLEQAGAAGRDVHLVVVDVEGAEAEALAGLDLARWKPWVLVVEATEPVILANVAEGERRVPSLPSAATWEPSLVAAGYRPTLFDGLSMFYVSEAHAAELAAALSYPACVLDNYVTAAAVRCEADLEQARSDAGRWREVALESWSAVVAEQGVRRAASDARTAQLEAELGAVRSSVSWRVTAPLRAVRSRELAARSRRPR